MKTYTREELSNITAEQFAAMSQEEQANVRSQGRAFLAADQGEGA